MKKIRKWYQHHVHRTIANPTDGVTHRVREEKNTLRWAYLTCTFEIFHSSSIKILVVAPYLNVLECHIRDLKAKEKRARVHSRGK